jgi:hypothetical protein
MRHDDLGIDPRTGRHDKILTPLESAFLGLLWVAHEGADNKISAEDLAAAFHYKRTAWPQELSHRMAEEIKREVRYIQNHLLTLHDIPVLSKAGTDGGYWIAASEAETEEFYESFRKRGLTGLVKASRGKKSLLQSIEQLTFEFDELADRTDPGRAGAIRPRVAGPAPSEVVVAVLDRMTRNPERFSDDLAKIGRKFGSVLLPKGALAMIQSRARELDALVGELGGEGG